MRSNDATVHVSDSATARPVSRVGRQRRGSRVLLPRLISDAVERAPDAEAIRFEGRSWTYAEVDAHSSRLARVLLSRGIGPEDRVAVAVPRSALSVIAVWAVAKTGAAFVPIDPNYPAARIAYMVRDSGPAVGLTTLASKPDLPDTVEWLVIDGGPGEALTRCMSSEPVSYADRVRPVRPGNAVWLIYTSGSTGTPKGVVVTHTGLAAYVAEQAKRFGLTRDSRTLHFASPSFDASMLELFMAIGASSTMVVVPPSIYGGDDLADLLRTERVSHMFVTPAALASLDPEGGYDLDVLAVGGERYSPDLPARWASGRQFVDVYGPTESTIATHLSGPQSGEGPIVVGAPNSATIGYVLDTRLRPVPVGVVGELYLAGPQLARGYHLQRGLTAGRFVADPFTPDGTRMYRTGDLVRRITERGLEVVGRTDSQIKIRGFRVEPAEVDAVLSTHPDVAFSVTVGRQAPSGETVLVTYVKARAGSDRIDSALRTHARHRLPRHMVPAAFVRLDHVPLSPAGKVDRDRLPAPVFERRRYQQPRSVAEHAVAAVFEEVLGLDRVGLHDNFFDLGGTSILASTVSSRLRLRLRTAVRVQWVLAEPDVEGLAERIDLENDFESKAAATRSSALEIVLPLRTGSGPPLFCVHPMVGLAWSYAGLATALDYTGSVYGLQTPALRDDWAPPRSIEEIARRHVEEIRALQPIGPYHLLGWSLGGVIAHAIAVELQSAGLEVGSLTLLDSYRIADPVAMAEQVAADFRALGEDVDSSEIGADLSDERAAEILRALDAEIGLTIQQVQRMYAIAVRSADFVNSYVPQHFHGDILYFLARSDPARLHTRIDAWRSVVTGDVKVRAVPAPHNDMTAPHAVEVIAPILSRWLADQTRASAFDEDGQSPARILDATR
ncbi:amino acid adenylation domain-containing protein [Rhodococcus ruber]|uniref:amino acid adenylation domain-containing protein n=1 Tax=Rhodococcus TaxID=1827 RepID=UPI0037834B07